MIELTINKLILNIIKTVHQDILQNHVQFLPFRVRHFYVIERLISSNKNF